MYPYLALCLCFIFIFYGELLIGVEKVRNVYHQNKVLRRLHTSGGGRTKCSDFSSGSPNWHFQTGILEYLYLLFRKSKTKAREENKLEKL